jgi:hypothetical protein
VPDVLFKVLKSRPKFIANSKHSALEHGSAEPQQMLSVKCRKRSSKPHQPKQFMIKAWALGLIQSRI